MDNTYTVSQSVRLFVEFRVRGVLTDPNAISLIITDPDETETTYTYAGATVTKHGTGQYYKDFTFSSAGDWTVKWVGAGVVDAATPETTLVVVE